MMDSNQNYQLTLTQSNNGARPKHCAVPAYMLYKYQSAYPPWAVSQVYIVTKERDSTQAKRRHFEVK